MADSSSIGKLKMKNGREQDAAIAYLKYLLTKGATPSALAQRETVLSHLDLYIGGISNNGVAYREAVEKCLAKVEKADWPFYLCVIREYFVFWNGNPELVAAAERSQAIDAEPVQWRTLEVDLKTIWSKLDKEKFSPDETRVLEAYQLALKQHDLKASVIATRVKLAKLLLLKLKNTTSKAPKIYRKAVNATVPIFELKDTRNLFLLVVREFYYFWVCDARATDYIFKETRQAESIE